MAWYRTRKEDTTKLAVAAEILRYYNRLDLASQVSKAAQEIATGRK